MSSSFIPSRQRFKHWQPPRKAASRVAIAEETPDAPFGPVFTEIPRSGISSTKSDGEIPKITETQTVACFNWLEGEEPHIIVPGMPPKWTPLDRPRTLKQDAGIYYRDRNAAHYPDNPLEPTVEAIMKLNPSVGDTMTVRNIDIFGCGSTLGELLRFVRGTQGTFRILVERLGKTVHLIRRGKSPLETIPNIRGYGHTFPESYTTWDTCSRGSSSHQRVVQFQFGGLECLVRFEGDGYLPDKAGERVKKESRLGRQELNTPEDLAALLSISGTASHSSKSPLKISEAGCLVPQGAVFDLKTRSIKRKDEEDAIIADELPRLWIRQISTLILAYHTCGTFRDIQIRDMRAEMAEWEELNREALACFAKLLKQIVDISSELQDGRMEITCKEGDDGLCFRTQTADVKPAFSTATESRWKAWLNHDATDGPNKPSSEDEVSVLSVVQKTLNRARGFKQRTDEEQEGGRGLDDDTPNYTACDEECDYCGHCK
ncbi:hypothetical protein NHJ13734_002650 [Beauveria thailandica]